MKMAFWGVFVAGLVACSAVGIGPVLKRMGGSWTSAPMLVGSVLGVAILVLAISYGMGIRPGVLATDKAMVYALVAMVGTKVAIGSLAMSGLLGRG